MAPIFVEGTVIVASILLAFGVDAWWDERQDREAEQEILAGLHEVRSEVLPMKWLQVDPKAGVIRLEPNTTKNDEGREFPFNPFAKLRHLLESQREQTPALEKEAVG